jgi:hypothetical protein
MAYRKRAASPSRFATCEGLRISTERVWPSVPEVGLPQIENLRYSRLQTCATSKGLQVGASHPLRQYRAVCNW